jgi:glycosyltransferase involved in cell wall biosynthesis
MKIALLHYSAPPIVGGVESVLAHHARLMSDAGHSVVIFAGRGKAFDAHIPVHILPLLDSRHPEVLKVKAELDQGAYTPAFDNLCDRIQQEICIALDGFDLLIAHNVASLHKNLALTAALHTVYSGPGFPRLVLWHHDLAWTAPRYKREMHDGYPWDLLRSEWQGAAHVVVSEQRRSELQTLLNIPTATIRVIPNGVDINSFYKLDPQTISLGKEMPLLTGDPLILLPVRLTARKNIELALAVLAELRRTLPDAMLLVTGPEGSHNPANAAYKQKLLRLRDTLNLQGAAFFMAEISPEILPDTMIADFFRLSDVLLFPSLEEGFGIPLIEAAFSNLPVFCTDIPVLRELGGEDVTYFSHKANPESIAGLMITRLQQEATSRWARRAKRLYTWVSIYTHQIEPFLQEVSA